MLSASTKKILFVCTVNRMRSLTAEHIFKHDRRFEVKSAGTDISATRQINRELLDWAQYIVVMENHHRNTIRKKFPDIYKKKKIICLNIPDVFPYMDGELIALLKIKMQEIFGKEM